MTSWELRGVRAVQGSFLMGPLDLGIGESETVAVIGRSGAGKTTLLRAIAGLVPLDAGEVLKGGTAVGGWPPERRRLAYVPQGLGLFPHLTVRRNVEFAARLRHPADAVERSDRLLRRFHLESFAARRPGELSTGEQQRVAVARALATEPELLLWDEPLGALDVATREELLEALATVREDDRIPLLLVTHDPSIAYSLADRFLLLEGGQMRFLGAAAPLVERPGDPFVARFLGYENVFSRAALSDLAEVPLGEWLLSRSGALGLAFGSGAVRLRDPPEAAWTASVRRREPSPAGMRLDLDVGGVPLSALVPLRGRDGAAAAGAIGASVGLDIDPADLHPLGGWP